MGLKDGQCLRMLHDVAAVIPKEAVVMNDQEVVKEFEKDTPMIEVSNPISLGWTMSTVW